MGWAARETATIGVEQNRPILTPGVQKVELSVQIARSQLATSWQPAAAAAVDLGDHRLRQPVDLQHQVGTEPQRRFEEGPSFVCVRAMRRQFLQIMAGRKEGAGGRQDHNAHIIGLSGGVQFRGQRFKQRDRQDVGGRIVERQPQHVAGKLAQHRAFGFFLVQGNDIRHLSSP